MRCVKCLVAAATLVPLTGLLIAWLGLIHVGATGGHWAVTEWFLHWTMRSSVRTAALSIEKPAGFENATVLQGAAVHFEGGVCRMPRVSGSPSLCGSAGDVAATARP